MYKQLISLVFLLMYLTFTKAYSDTNLTILPQNKPEILSSKISKDKKKDILPLKKPIFKKQLTNIQNNQLPQKKPEKEIKKK